jgi:enoyl-CoA hydratase
VAGVTILRRDEGAVAVLTINRPHAMNALDTAALRLLGEHVDTIGEEDGTRVIVITGAGGKAFSAGGDMNEMRGPEAVAATESLEAWEQTLERIEGSTKPVIAAINGYAYGGGTELAMACHIRVASAGAKLGQTEMAHDHIPGSGGTQRLPRLIPLGLAYEYLLTGDTMEAPEALRLGLLNHVWPDAELMPKTLELAARIAARSPEAVRCLMEAVRGGLDAPLETGLKLERKLAIRVLGSADAQAGLDKFFNKKKAAK